MQPSCPSSQAKVSSKFIEKINCPEAEDSDGEGFIGLDALDSSISPDGKRLSHNMIRKKSFSPHPSYRKSRVDHKGFPSTPPS